MDTSAFVVVMHTPVFACMLGGRMITNQCKPSVSNGVQCVLSRFGMWQHVLVQVWTLVLLNPWLWLRTRKWVEQTSLRFNVCVTDLTVDSRMQFLMSIPTKERSEDVGDTEDEALFEQSQKYQSVSLNSTN